MTDMLTITTERVDDIPLLLAQMHRMGLPQLLDEQFTVHGNRQGLAFGWTTVLWLAHVLSQADHRMNQVQPWAARRLETLRRCSRQDVQVADLSDDRLAAVLRTLSDDEQWAAFERVLTGHLVRVYALCSERVRLDSTTVSSHGTVTADGLLQFGHSKDHRPDLPQLKVMLATLDPLALPLASDVVSGERPDDPLYLPVIRRVQASLGQPGLLYVGDCKLGALATRAAIAQSQDFYLCPLSAVQVPSATLDAYLAEAQASGSPLSITRPQADRTDAVIATGYERQDQLTGSVDGMAVTWTERRLLVRSLSQAHAAETALRARLERTAAALADLAIRRRGKARLADRDALDAAVARVLAEADVADLVRVTITDQWQERHVRAYRTRPAEVQRVYQFTLTVTIDAAAVETAVQHLGWRVYATNQVAAELSLSQAVLAYREEYLIEHSLGRLKGRPLSLAPMYVERDDHATGLVRLLTIALRVLSLVEFVVRRQLAQTGERIAGLYAGNPQRVTERPSTEQILGAFEEITLTVLVEAQQTRRHVTALSALQHRLLMLLELPLDIYTRLGSDSAQPP
jgi:transposase